MVRKASCHRRIGHLKMGRLNGVFRGYYEIQNGLKVKIPQSSRQRGIIMSIVGFNLFQKYNFSLLKQPFAQVLGKIVHIFLIFVVTESLAALSGFRNFSSIRSFSCGFEPGNVVREPIS